MERALRIGTRQDARAIELVDLSRELVSRLHIGDRVVRHGVDGLVSLFCAVEDVDELAARDRRVHLCLGVIRVVLFDDTVRDCVADVAVVPVRAAVFQADLASAVELMQSRRQLDGLCDRQRRVRFELIGRHAVDQVVLLRCLDAGIVPAIGRNIGERELSGVRTGVRVERVLRRLARRHRNDRCRRGRQLRDDLPLGNHCVAALAADVAGIVAGTGSARIFRVLADPEIEVRRLHTANVGQRADRFAVEVYGERAAVFRRIRAGHSRELVSIL